MRTGLDVNLQREAENTVESMLRQYGKEYGASQAGAVVMDIDGAVRAMVGGRDYGAEPVQPRDRRAAPARLLVQALRLCRPR